MYHFHQLPFPFTRMVIPKVMEYTRVRPMDYGSRHFLTMMRKLFPFWFAYKLHIDVTTLVHLQKKHPKNNNPGICWGSLQKRVKLVLLIKTNIPVVSRGAFVLMISVITMTYNPRDIHFTYELSPIEGSVSPHILKKVYKGLVDDLWKKALTKSVMFSSFKMSLSSFTWSRSISQRTLS